MSASVLACGADCDCGCQKGKKCACEKCKENNCDCGCQKGEKCKCSKKCKCKKNDCECGCQKGDDCKCSCKKSKKFKIFKKKQIKCNCDEE